MAGKKLAQAVPEVQIRTTGLWEALACPNAKNAAERSSKIESVSNFEFLVAPIVKGVDREPGQVITNSTPNRAMTSATKAPTDEFKFERARASNWLVFCIKYIKVNL